MRVAPLMLALVAAVGLSGCFGSADGFEARGEDARVLPRYSYAYDGSGVDRAVGQVTIRLDESDNDGTIHATVTEATARYEVEWVAFRGEAGYQSGGVARDLRLHGATGLEGPALPEVFAYAAAWGTAAIRVNGEPQRDPTTGAPEFPSRLLVVRGHVRDPDTGVIYDAGRTRPYDPGRPEDGSVDPAGAQALLELRTETGELWYHFEFEAVTLERV